MWKKILKSKAIHVIFDHKVLELYSEVILAPPEDFKNEHGLKCDGIWDTGSEGCLISSKLATKLNLPKIGFKRVIGVNDDRLSPEYLLNLFLSNGVSFEMVTALVAENIGEDEVLIGMSIINQGDFAVTNVNKKTTMSFRIPSIRRINFEEDYKKAQKEEEDLNRKSNKKTWNTKKGRKRQKPRR